MASDVGSSSASGSGQGPLKVAVIEQRAETLQYVLALAAESAAMTITTLDDAASFFEVYGNASGPDILLVGLDSGPQEALTTAKRISVLAPTCGIIVYGHSATMELLSQAMAAGVRRYLPYPFDKAALLAAVNDVYEEMKPLIASSRFALPSPTTTQAAVETAKPSTHEPKVIAVFSPKGGVGTSTIAVNLACALQSMGRRVVIVDGNISFGNVGVFLNLSPTKSMLQAIGESSSITLAAVEEVLLQHASGLRVLLAPLNPEEGEAVHGDHLRHIITLLRSRYDYVVVDTWPSYDERVLAMLEVSDQILAPTGPELPAVKNIASFLRVTRLLEYPKDKIIPVLVRANSVTPSHLADIESFLKQPLVWRIISDGRRVTQSINNGEPFTLMEPEAPVSQNIFAIARMLDGQDTPATTVGKRNKPLWMRPFSLLRRAG